MILKNVEKKENNTAVFEVETDAAEFETAVNGAYLKNRGNIYIPGFRKGKAPRSIVEGMYGKEVFYQDAMDELAPKAYEQGLNESELHVVGAPAIQDLKVTDERTVVYTFAVSLYPEVTLGQYKGLEAVKDSTSVSDEEVEHELESLRKRNARKVSVDDREAQMGDTVNIDFDGYLNGERFDGGKAENYSLELGSHSFVPGFEEQVSGMKIGEEKEINITFPDDYVENLAGKPVVFKIKLNSITVDELPELDDEFAKDVSEFNTLDEYREDIRRNLQNRKNEQSDNAFRDAVMKQAIDNMTVTVPEVMVAEKAEEIIRNYAANFGMDSRGVELPKLMQMMGIDQNIMNSSIRPSAEMQVRSDLLIEAVANAENIETSDEEVEDYIKRMAEKFNASVDDLKQYFGMDTMVSELKKEKAVNLIVDSAVAKDAADEEKTEENTAEETAE